MKYTKPAVGGFYYPDHLPVLGMQMIVIVDNCISRLIIRCVLASTADPFCSKREWAYIQGWALPKTYLCGTHTLPMWYTSESVFPLKHDDSDIDSYPCIWLAICTSSISHNLGLEGSIPTIFVYSL